MHILRYSSKGHVSWNPVKSWKALGSHEFFERAKPSRVLREKGRLEPWMSYDDNWIDEVRRGFSACAVFAWLPIYCELKAVCLPDTDRY